jgi:hypothetical protein
LLSGFTIRRKISKKVKFPNHFPPPIFPPHTHSTRTCLYTHTLHFPNHTPKDNKKACDTCHTLFYAFLQLFTADDFSYYAFPAHAKQLAVGVEPPQALP